MRVKPAYHVRSFFWPAILAAVVSLCQVLPRQASLAQVGRRGPAGNPPVASTKPAAVAPVVDPLHAEAFIQERLIQVDQETAGLIASRGDGPDPLLQFRINMRLEERWMLQMALQPRQDVGLRINLLLRQQQVARAAAALDEYVLLNPVTIDLDKNPVFKTIHATANKLPKGTSSGELDNLCDDLGLALLGIFSGKDSPADPDQPANQSVDAARLVIPRMRPKAPAVVAPAGFGGFAQYVNPNGATMATTFGPGTGFGGMALGAPATQPAVQPPRLLRDMAQSARDLPVPDALHQELLALADSAEQIFAIGLHDRDPRLVQVLGDCEDLITDMKIVPLSDAAKNAIYSKMTDGVALFMDLHTRNKGLDALATLKPYRLALLRVDELGMPPEMQASMGPALAWTVQHPADGPQMLKVLGRYFDLVNQNAARVRPKDADPLLQTSMNGLDSQFDKASAHFMTVVGQANVTPLALVPDCDEMARALDLDELIAKLPASFVALRTLHLQPPDAIQRRADEAASLVTAPTRMTSTAASLQFIHDVTRYADATAAINQHPLSDLPADISRTYLQGYNAQFEAQWSIARNDLAGQAALGRPLNAAKLQRMELAAQILNAVDAAVARRQTLAKLSSLQNWVDWQITADQTSAIFEPYDAALAAAFVGYADDNRVPVERWQQLLGTYRPLELFIADAANQADQCAAMPGGAVGAAADLVTPIAYGPFLLQRQVGIEVMLWDFDNQARDPVSANQLFTMFAGQVKAAYPGDGAGR
jgi:hypothetical protein